MSAGGHKDPTSNPEALVRVAPDADFSAVEISVQEGFVLSRVDGNSSVKTLCLLSGMGEDPTRELLLSLWRKGIIIVGNRKAVLKGPTKTPSSLHPAVDPDGNGAGKGETNPFDAIDLILKRHEDDPPFEEEIRDEAVDIPKEARRRIRVIHQLLDELNLYQLLGLKPTEDLKAIRRAYFSRSKEFHPDRYFNRKTGDYQEKLKDIFKRVSNAYRILENEGHRATYMQRMGAARQELPLLWTGEKAGKGGPWKDRKRAGMVERMPSRQVEQGADGSTYRYVRRQRGGREGGSSSSGDGAGDKDEHREPSPPDQAPPTPDMPPDEAAPKTSTEHLDRLDPTLTADDLQVPVSTDSIDPIDPIEEVDARSSSDDELDNPMSTDSIDRVEKLDPTPTKDELDAPMSTDTIVRGEELEPALTDNDMEDPVSTEAIRRIEEPAPESQDDELEELLSLGSSDKIDQPAATDSINNIQPVAPSPSGVGEGGQAARHESRPDIEEVPETPVIEPDSEGFDPEEQSNSIMLDMGRDTARINLGKLVKPRRAYERGQQLMAEGDMRGALDSFRMALSFSPDNSEYRKTYTEAVSLARDSSAEAYYQRGLLEQAVGHLDVAYGLICKAASLEPKEEFLLRAAQVGLQLGDLLAARVYAKRAVEKQPYSKDAHLMMAQILLASGRQEEARRELEAVLEKSPNDADAREMLEHMGGEKSNDR